MTTRAAAAAETAEKILDATKHLFAENVIAEITLADIAERSGVTVQTILRRFGDKDGVFAEAISRLGAEILSQRGQAISNDLDDLLANLVEHYETHGRLVLKMLAEELTTPAIQPALAFGRRYHRRWCETVFAATLEPLTGADKDRRRAQLIAICDVRTWEVLRIRSGFVAPTNPGCAARDARTPHQGSVKRWQRYWPIRRRHWVISSRSVRC